jgi:hypothetical protein
MAKSLKTWEERIVCKTDRFFTLVDNREPSECWPWRGPKNLKGYGQFCGSNSQRAAFYYANGRFDLSLHVLHKCDTRDCQNPSHLFLGTNLDNIADKMVKGRHLGPRGEKCATHKLNVEQVLQIRALRATGNLTLKQIAQRFNVGWKAIQKIVTRQRWAHVAVLILLVCGCSPSLDTAIKDRGDIAFNLGVACAMNAHLNYCLDELRSNRIPAMMTPKEWELRSWQIYTNQ